MTDHRVASRYVKSLLGLAVEQNALEAVHADMVMFDGVCDTNREFLLMMRSPIIKHDLKRDLLERIFKKNVHPLTWSILDIITRKNRESLLPAIADEFHVAYNEFKGIGFASVTTAIEIDPAVRKEIEEIAKKLSTRSQVELETKVNPDLIGGFVLNVGDRQIDASVSSKLNALRLTFKQNPYQKEI